ncbi:MAG: hypothetical protein UW02_C0002G0016 [Candidatus Nomurabacteria bacterium GW2011_GWB1_43_7]|uniref:Uncharacterized protein n=1 Tax=Candidatus Nomurabacteria bacterium GW2011_GWB1_43_7 TaxID=1618747 RepID=A0A0G1I9Y8_9BACT|nr:MAG: hypothetical protein UW02_C0002G0016 [Candidatus Nomurabacteria bacterium GW2011_GWB1_43_7]
MADKDFIPTPRLLDEEARLAQERRDKISRITLEIEQILLREDLTMGELGEVMDMFNARAHAVFSQTKLKIIKQNYESS